MTNIAEHFPNEHELIKQIMNISATVWKHEITGKDMQQWLSNFTGQAFDQDGERIIALWLLTHFVYYNEDEVRHLCKVLYRDFIHYLLEANNIRDENIAEFTNESISKYNFHYLGKASESGAYILYYFRQQNDLALMSFPKTLAVQDDLPDNLVFVDDVTLSGDDKSQAYAFFKKYRTKKKQKILLTLIASDLAISNLAEIGVTVISAITLDSRNKCFNRESEIFKHQPELLEPCRTMALHYGKILSPKDPLGYKGGQYTFGFFYNTPDNSLPIFWSTTNNWFPIMKRYEKNHQTKFFEHERFI
jgi:hypothetical protein